MEARYVKDINDAAIIAHYVRKCHHCGATFARSFPSMKEADAAWNRRAGNDTNVPTNADRIRSMSDEELAEYIFDLGNGSEYCYGHCAYQDDCATKGLDHDTCIKGVIDWLKQPVKEE
jgi:hypothetical protein